jgi:hypothetical protein
MRHPGSMNWAGINNTFYWIDPESQIGVIVLMQILPFYDDAAIKILQGVEERVYQHVSRMPQRRERLFCRTQSQKRHFCSSTS